MIRLITNEAEYRGGFFPKIPPRVPGQDTLLINADGIPQLVTDYTTVRDIRRGNFNNVVRVSTSQFSVDIFLNEVSENAPFKFDIKIGVECKVYNSVAYYMSHKAYILEDSISRALSRIVSPEARRFQLTDNSVSYEIMKTLQSKGIITIEALGVQFFVDALDVNPDAEAEGFVKDMSVTTLKSRAQQHSIKEGAQFATMSMEGAIMQQVAESKITMEDAIIKLRQSNRGEGYNNLEDMERVIAFVRKLQTDNIIADSEAEQRISELLRGLQSIPGGITQPLGISAQKTSDEVTGTDSTIGDLYKDGDT